MGASKKSDKPTVVDGIEIDVTAEDFDDYEITECLAALGDPDAEEGEQLTAMVRFFKLLFKSDYQRVKDELRAANGGKLTNEAMGAFANRVIEAAKAKN